MAGIISSGVYIPRLRLTGEVLAGAWGGSKKGGRSLANHDEDCITMAAEAALECLGDHDPLEVDRIYFASTTPPYLEHGNAAIVAAVADLRADVMAVDFGGSLRAGTSALRAAYDAVKAEEADKVLVCAADMRMPAPGDPMERTIGDGAAAFLVGKEKPVARFQRFFSSSRVFLDRWRRAGDPYLQSGDPRFISEQGIMTHLPEIAEEMIKGLDVTRDEISRVVYYSPDMRSRRGLDKKLGFDASQYLQDIPQAAIGDTGNSQVFLSLAAALAQSEPGDNIALFNYGSGADACLLEATEHVKEFSATINEQMDAGRPVSSYARYLRFRGQLPGEDIDIWTSAPVLWREEDINIRRYGKKCNACGAIQFPPRYKCWSCGGEDMAPYKVSRRGRVYTFALDSLVPNPEPPTPMVSVD
ncbi:MAG: zinc ribbon domain-containing protein, partial [bacterium]